MATFYSNECLGQVFYSPIQLAAISNFKLAQLTFAPPDLHSLRKTAVVKNMIESIYSTTPPAWLQQMTRWQFFTPESLESMTQQGLEEIFAIYAQTIEAFRPLKTSISSVDLITEDIKDDLDDSCLFSNEKRLSWTSDTGVAVSQNLANEIMSLFDMDFSVDMDVAPKLPELSFKRRRKARLSQELLSTSLLPAFEKIVIENSNPIKKLPQRSSSLGHLKELEESQYPLSPPVTPVERNAYFKKEEEEKDMPRKTSSSSSWSFVSDRKEKPLPETPHYENKHKLHAKKKRKSAVVMEKTMSKRKSAMERTSSKRKSTLERTQSKRKSHNSKSKFIKLGRSKKEEKKEGRTQGFVKRVASFMKSRKIKTAV